MPLASMSKATSTCGMPRGAGGMPVSWNLPMVRLSRAIWRSPWSTWISTVVWLSSAVENTSDFLVGIVVFRGIRTVVTPPSVSMPSDKRVTSRSKHILHVAAKHAALDGGPDRRPPRRGSPTCWLLAEELRDDSWILGIRVDPPTRMTSSIALASIPASSSAFFIGGSDPLDQVVHQLLELGPGEASSSDAWDPTGRP